MGVNIKKGTSNVEFNSETYPYGSFFAKMEEREEGTFLYFYTLEKRMICQGKVGDYTIDDVQVTVDNWKTLKDDLIKSMGGSGGSYTFAKKYLHVVHCSGTSGGYIKGVIHFQFICNEPMASTSATELSNLIASIGATSEARAIQASGYIYDSQDSANKKYGNIFAVLGGTATGSPLYVACLFDIVAPPQQYTFTAFSSGFNITITPIISVVQDA